MRGQTKLLGALLLGTLVACQGNIGGDQDTLAPIIGAGDPAAIPGQYIVVLSQRGSPNLVSDLVTQVGLTPGNLINHSYKTIPAFAAQLTDTTLEEIRKHPDVQFVEVDRIVTLNAVHDTTANDLHGLDRIDQRDLPGNGTFDDLGNTGAGVHFYGIDTGIRSTHIIFEGRMSNGFDAVNDGRGTEDCNDHGTHTAGTAVGDIVGVARQAIVHPVRVLGCTGSGSISGIIAGVDFARTDCASNGGPCVANLSLGGGASSALDSAVTSAVNSGVVMVVAAGNENQNACNVSPARAAAAITVAASDSRNDTRASFSNFGDCVDLFAPGVSILSGSSQADDSAAIFDGTSMAAPHVAGVVAAFLGANPSASPSQVANALVSSATANKISGANGSPNLLLFNNLGGGTPPPPPPPEGSCEGRCGLFDSGAQCQCDDQCAQAGDCCADIEEVCSAPPGATVLLATDFEANLGGFIDGGSDAGRVSGFANSGSISVRLRDNAGSRSSIFTNGMNLTSFGELTIEFSFIANSMESGEDFFIDVDSGSGFVAVGQLISGTDFSNNVRSSASLTLNSSNINFSSSVRVRIRADASANSDQVFIDDVIISAQ